MQQRLFLPGSTFSALFQCPHRALHPPPPSRPSLSSTPCTFACINISAHVKNPKCWQSYTIVWTHVDTAFTDRSVSSLEKNVILGIHPFDAENTNCRLYIACVFCGGRLVSYVPHPHPPSPKTAGYQFYQVELCALFSVGCFSL